MQRIYNLFPTETITKIIVMLTAWQFISVALMAVGTWSPKVAVVNTILLSLFIVMAKPYHSVLLLVLAIPFYIVLPNQFLENLPMWRVLFALLFIIWIIRLLISQRQWLLRVFEFKRWYADSFPTNGAQLRAIIPNAFERISSRLMEWDKVAVLFLLIAVCSLLIARFQIHGLKQVIFIVNVYIFYLVIINVVTDQFKVKELIRYTMYSLGIMVGLGFIQYIGTLFASSYYFWQYWATQVSSLYYGQSFADVLIYSNSWFSGSGGTQALRMFGVLPDTHAFGVMCIFLLAFVVSLFNVKETGFVQSVKGQKWYALATIVLAGFGVMASGTRGIWLAMLGPLVLAAFAYWRNFFKPFMKVALATYGVVIILFVLSPLISQAMNFIRTIDVEDNFLDRAQSIYDLSESSNVGRLEIWRESIQYAAVHPFGVGYGNFIISIIPNIPEDASFESVSGMKNLRYNLPQEFITAHSLYLQLLVELGFAGLLAFLLFWWEYAERLWQFLRAQKNSLPNRYIHLTLGIALAFVWLLAYGAFDVTILNDRVLQYMFVCLAISGLIFAKYDTFTPEE